MKSPSLSYQNTMCLFLPSNAGLLKFSSKKTFISFRFMYSPLLLYKKIHKLIITNKPMDMNIIIAIPLDA